MDRTMDNKFSWGEWIRSNRQRLGLSQQSLAMKIGASLASVSRWERNIEPPRQDFQKKLSALFQQNLPGISGKTGSNTTTIPPMTAVYDPAIPPLAVPEIGLIGRDDLQKRLISHLCAHGGSYALRGMHGVGKTALASELAHKSQIHKHFSDGILWAGLGRNPSLLGLLSRWGTLLRISPNDMAELATVESWQEAIRDTIGMRRMLLFIDDAWSPDEALVFKLGGLNCVHLVTTCSQEVALAFTRNHDRIFLIEELNQEYSIRLLHALSPMLTTNSPGEVETLARSAGGLPLALTIMGRHIQMAGGNNQSRRVLEAIERLRNAEERLRLTLLQPISERPPHLSVGTPLSLYASIGASDQRLDPDSRYVLHTLSVFPAKPHSFSEEAALAVCKKSARNLDKLVDMGLLACRGQERYTLHQTIADYARLQLEAGTVVKDQEAVKRLMVQYFTSYIRKRPNNYDTLEEEMHNVLVAFQVACDQGWVDELASAIDALAPFLEAKGLYALVEPYLEQASWQARKIGDTQSLTTICLHLGRTAQLGKDLKRAEAYYEEGLQAAQTVGNRCLMAAFEANWGEVIVHSGDCLRAEAHLLAARELIEVLGSEPASMSNLLRNLGEVANTRGDWTLANELYLQGLILARQVNDYKNMSALLQNLGVNAERNGEYQKADRYYDEGLTCARKAKHQQRISAMLMNIGMLEYKRGNLDKALEFYNESLDIARKIKVPVRVSSVLQNLGMLESKRDHYQQAEKYLQESLDIAYEIGHIWLISETLFEWGECYLRQDKLTEAEGAFRQSLLKAGEIEGKELIACAEFGLARIEQRRGNKAEALHWAQSSLQDFQGTGNEMAHKVKLWLESLEDA